VLAFLSVTRWAVGCIRRLVQLRLHHRSSFKFNTMML
jgi:hypothetical protein